MAKAKEPADSKVAQLRAMRERNYRERMAAAQTIYFDQRSSADGDDEPTPRPVKRPRKKGK